MSYPLRSTICNNLRKNDMVYGLKKDRETALIKCNALQPSNYFFVDEFNNLLLPLIYNEDGKPNSCEVIINKLFWNIQQKLRSPVELTDIQQIQYNNFLKQTAILTEYIQGAYASRFCPEIPGGKFFVYKEEDEKIKINILSSKIRRLCKYGIEFAISYGLHVHFIITNLDMIRVTKKVINWEFDKKESPEEDFAVTSSELRFIYRNWENEKFSKNITFYNGISACREPWEDSRFSYLWNHYIPKHLKDDESEEDKQVRKTTIRMLEELKFARERYDFPPSQEAPRKWEPDASRKQCPVCEKPFHIISRRRHHCRKCGRVVCGDCTRYTTVAYTSSPVRICLHCIEDYEIYIKRGRPGFGVGH